MKSAPIIERCRHRQHLLQVNAAANIYLQALTRAAALASAGITSCRDARDGGRCAVTPIRSPEQAREWRASLKCVLASPMK